MLASLAANTHVYFILYAPAWRPDTEDVLVLFLLSFICRLVLQLDQDRTPVSGLTGVYCAR